MGKAVLRSAIRARRAAGHVASPGLVDRVLAQIPTGSAVCCYVDLPGEPPTSAVIEALLGRGDAVYLPVAGPAGQLEWVEAAGNRPWDAWGVPGRPTCQAPRVELPAVDVVVLPALAVTHTGQRLGQGGGYYDRFVPQQPRARRIALIWSGEILPDVSAEPHDVAVDTWVVADG